MIKVISWHKSWFAYERGNNFLVTMCSLKIVTCVNNIAWLLPFVTIYCTLPIGFPRFCPTVETGLFPIVCQRLMWHPCSLSGNILIVVSSLQVETPSSSTIQWRFCLKKAPSMVVCIRIPASALAKQRNARKSILTAKGYPAIIDYFYTKWQTYAGQPIVLNRVT